MVLCVLCHFLCGLVFEPHKDSRLCGKQRRFGLGFELLAMDTMVCTSLSYRAYEYNNTDCGSEGFVIDDLLDFSNDDIGAPIDEENTSEETSLSASVDGNYSPENENNQTTNQDAPEELCVPMDSLEDLEWLSNFVEDSFSVGGLAEFPSCYLLPSVDGKKDHYKSSDDDENKAKQQTQQKQNSNNNNVVFSACKDLGAQWIPVRARRSKRCRAGGRLWTFCPLLPSHHPGFESQASIFSSSDSSSNSCVTYSRPPKKHKPHHNNNASKKSHDANAAPARRCSHCLVQKTPQWRAGPLGPKTLCNACGVRFKSGRLLPEYRPAVSPTFLSDVHSNSHRKVLELRRQKEQEDQKQVFTTLYQEQEDEKPIFTNVHQEQEEQKPIFTSVHQEQEEQKQIFTFVKQEQDGQTQIFASVKQEQDEQKKFFTAVKQAQEEEKQIFASVQREQEEPKQEAFLA